MLRKKLTVSVSVGLTVVAVVTGIAFGQDLVAFDRAKIAEVKLKCDLSVIAKIDNRAVGVLERGRLAGLLSIDDSALLLEASTDINRLWVAGCKIDSPDLPGKLLRTERFQLLKLPFDQAEELLKAGYYLSKCRLIDLPADPLFIVQAKMPSRSSLIADIDSLMALVSIDSVESYLQRLQDFQTRYTCTDSFWVSGQWIADKFASWGYDNVSFEEFNSPFGCDSRNVIVEKIGDIYSDKFIIVGGHYDAVVYDGGDPTVFAPGADDNGTGTVLAMEIARVLADTPFRKTVRFIAFGAEEQGLIGSWYHVAGVLNRGEDVELMINADMIGNVADDYLNFNIMCNERGYPYGQVLGAIADEYTVLIPEIEVGEFYGSDHYPFDQSGFRTVYSEEGDFSPNWHRQTDIIENVDVPYASDIIRSNLGMLLIALDAPVPVAGLTAFNAGDGHTAYLQWESSDDIDVIGYEVYVGTSEEGVAIYDTSYVAADSVYGLTEEQTYYFGVAAITSDGGRSLIENFVQFIPRSIPGSPETLTVMPQPGSLRVEWTAVPDMDFSYYQVYRKVGPDDSYQPHSRVFQDEVFVDQDLQSNIYYYYKVTQVDTTGLESEMSPEDYSKTISLDSGILLVDETRDYSGGQGNPSDAEQDSFYHFISEGYPVSFYDINGQGVMRINDIGAYSTIAWMDDDPTSKYLGDVDEVLAQYLGFGGNLLFVGWRSLVEYGIGRPLEFDQEEFPFEYLLMREVNSTNLPDFSGAAGINGWPDLTVLPERVIPQWNGRLIGIDVVDFGQGASAIYNYISASGDTLFHGRPSGITVENQEYRVVYLTFPLYPMGDLDARETFVFAMEFLGEQSSDVDEFVGTESLPSAFLSQNYPNPFNNETRIKFVLAEQAKARLVIYNVLGQEIAVLADGEFSAGVHYAAWDGNGLPSGVYFYRLMLDGGSISRRMTMVR